jgi:hypothetical protein
MALLREHRIDYMKGGPSVTSKHQPCDVSSNFRDFKTGMRTVQNRGLNVENNTLNNNLNNAMDALLTEHSEVVLPQGFREKVINACSKIVCVMRHKYVSGAKSAEGFVRCGQHIPHVEPGALTVSYQKVMGSSMNDCTDAELARMKDKLPLCVAEMARVGRLSNQFLDDLQIATTDGAVDRDELVLCRQDAQLVTSVDTCARHREYQEQREARAADPNAAPVPQVMGRREAQKVLDQQQRKEAKKIEKDTHKSAETERRAAMTPAQRQMEDNVKKAEKAAKKAAKAQAQAQSIAQAMQTLNVL